MNTHDEARGRALLTIERMIKFYETNGWARGAMARRASRHRVLSCADNAVNFCYLGAGTQIKGEDLETVKQAFQIATGHEVYPGELNDNWYRKSTAVRYLHTVKEMLLA